MVRVDLTSRRFKGDPYPFYARLRAEEPVARVRLGRRRKAWLVSRYDDAVAVLKDPRLIKNKQRALNPQQQAAEPWMPAFFRPLTRNMLDLDPPDHRRLKQLVHRAFTPRVIEEQRKRIKTLAVELLDRVSSRDRFDLIQDFALPLPSRVIAWMLGVPEQDWSRFHSWSSRIVAADTSSLATLRALPSMYRFVRYLERLITARRKDPADDLLSLLLQAREEEDALDEEEVLAMAFLLLVAGHETTVNLIGNGMLSLLSHRDQWERLCRDPALLPSAVEECLRYQSPLLMATERYASDDFHLKEAEIRRGELVFAVLASATRDEEQFPDAATFDISRSPNRHLAFGQGIHFCLGAPLARMEGAIAIGLLSHRFPHLRLAADPKDLPWRPGLVLRGLERLPVYAR